MTDSETSSVLYNLDLPTLRRSRMLFKSAAEDNDFGKTAFHALKSRIDVEVIGVSIEMNPRKSFSSDYTFVSPAWQNATMTWTMSSGLKTVSYVLTSKSCLSPDIRARLRQCHRNHLASWSFWKPKRDNQARKDEIVVTGLTLAYLLVTIRSSSTAVVAGSA